MTWMDNKIVKVCKLYYAFFISYTGQKINFQVRYKFELNKNKPKILRWYISSKNNEQNTDLL